MLKDERGFIVYESIVALVCIVILCVSILPLMMNILMKTEESKGKAASWMVLYEQLQTIQSSGELHFTEIERDNIIFITVWDQNEGVCVYYETHPAAKEQTCINY